MAAIDPGFNATDVPPNDDFEPIPAGHYLAILTDSEEVETKSGDGTFHKLCFEVQEPAEFKGRKLWDRLNLKNKSAEAVRIAYGTLSALCRAVGVMQPRDTQELHGLPVCVKVKLSKRKDTGDTTNEIAAYKPKSEYKPGGTAPTGAAPGGAGAAPWSRK